MTNPSQKLVEIVGSAIDEAWNRAGELSVNLPPIEFSDDELRYLARAVLTAMLTPTPGMIDCGQYAFEGVTTPGPFSHDDPEPVVIWQAMITAALNQEEG